MASDKVLVTGRGQCYHRIISERGWVHRYWISKCGLESPGVNLEQVSISQAEASGYKPCKKCYHEVYCELCGEKTTLRRKTIVDTKIYQACEVCWSEFALI